MSMELYVALTSALPSAEQIAARLKRDGIAWSAGPIDWTAQSGYLPMTINGHDSGIEVDTWDAAAANEALAAFSLPAAKERKVVAFRWGGDLAECACAFATGSGIAAIAGGHICDPQSGEVLSPAKALAAAVECLNGIS